MERRKLTAYDEQIRRDIEGENFIGALETMLHAYQHSIVRFCNNMLGDFNYAEDMAHDVFLAAYTGLPRYKQKASVKTWLFSIARNQCKKFISKHRGRRTLKVKNQHIVNQNIHPPCTPLSVEEQYIQKQLEQRVGEGLMRINEMERGLLVLRYNECARLSDIAHIFGVSVPTVRKRLKRALKHLRKIIENE